MEKSLSFTMFTQGLIKLLESKTMSIKKECPMTMTVEWNTISNSEDDECDICHDFMGINEEKK
jgi:hypothetical protein